MAGLWAFTITGRVVCECRLYQYINSPSLVITGLWLLLHWGLGVPMNGLNFYWWWQGRPYLKSFLSQMLLQEFKAATVVYS